MKKIVIFGGGTGISCVLSGLKLFPVDVTAVITVSDDGSSTGVLKNCWKMKEHITKCLMLAIHTVMEKPVRELQIFWNLASMTSGSQGNYLS